ncbi:MAG: SgcJ/EcaC family oxidoreductase [Actinomycetota bacterium]|nr:SgcJ/EcaC family oxidoreductase [Actinomycetota bacterium]
MATHAQGTVGRSAVGTESRKRLLIGLGGVLVLALVVLGIWAIVQAVQPTEMEVATDLVDEWTVAWNANDPDAVAALFTEDVVYASPARHLEGRDNIHNFVAGMSSSVTHGEVLGEGTVLENGAVVFPMSYVFSGDETWAGEVEVTLEDGLISRFEWLHWELQE